MKCFLHFSKSFQKVNNQKNALFDRGKGKWFQVKIILFTSFCFAISSFITPYCDWLLSKSVVKVVPCQISSQMNTLLHLFIIISMKWLSITVSPIYVSKMQLLFYFDKEKLIKLTAWHFDTLIFSIHLWKEK